jgi:ABC-type multidrug transport system fused ATPase/permease subunit
VSAWRFFGSQFRRSGRLVAWSVVAALAQSLLLVPIALLVRHAFDHDLRAGTGGDLVLTAAAILALVLGTAALGLTTRYLALRTTKDAIARLRAALLTRLCAMPRETLDRRDAGTLQAIVVQDSERLDVMSNALVAQLLPAAVASAALGVLLIVLDPLLALILTAALPPMLVLNRKLGRLVRARTRRWQTEFDRFSGQTGLLLRAMTLVKATASEGAELDRRRAQVASLSRAGLEMAWMQSAYTLLQGAVAAAAGVIVLVAGGLGVAAGTLTIGELVGFYTALALLRGQGATILLTVPQVLAGTESLARLHGLFEGGGHEPYSGTDRIELTGGFAFEEVTFGYTATPVLEGVSFGCRPGERVAVVGPNGAGKSTIVSLLLGLYRPWTGRVLLDGVPLDEIDLVSARRRIGVVLEDPIVLPASVAENIAFGLPDATRDQIVAAAERASAREFVEELPDGFDTAIGDEGELISGGQRQRIALARALLRDPSLLVLDEPTSHIDAATIPEILEEVARLPRSPTVVIVTHDERAVSACDRTIVVEDGSVRERAQVTG